MHELSGDILGDGGDSPASCGLQGQQHSRGLQGQQQHGREHGVWIQWVHIRGSPQDL